MLEITSSLPRAGSWTTSRADSLAALAPTLHATLEQERDFRRDQLAQLDPAEEMPWSSALGGCLADQPEEAALALREVDALIVAGARRALADIEMALARMHAGGYGDCRTCGVDIPLVVLEAIPHTTLCLACQHHPENDGTGTARAPCAALSAWGARPTPDR
jgi:DnaK suppressor protein